MFTELTLSNFKNFRDTTLQIGSLTLLIGANASGKSNLRDAFRFLHGIGRGYKVADILEGASGEGGERVWNGVRGGTSELCYRGESEVSLRLKTDLISGVPHQSYKVALKKRRRTPTGDITIDLLEIDEEILAFQERSLPHGIFSTIRDEEGISSEDEVRVRTSHGEESEEIEFFLKRDQPILSQLRPHLLDQLSADTEDEFERGQTEIVGNAVAFERKLRDMRFLDFTTAALRAPSKVGQTTLGDRGQNLASTLMEICLGREKKDTIVDWLETLTPMDAKDIEFEVGPRSNEVTAVLIESDGTGTPLSAASDGTLRFLALLALLFQADPPNLIFLEEIETGLHPTRLDLLINLLEQRTEQADVQVIASTHSPRVLRTLSESTLDEAQLVYRTGEGPEANICPILEVPSAKKVLDEPNQSVDDLHETGWFETIMKFNEG